MKHTEVVNPVRVAGWCHIMVQSIVYINTARIISVLLAAGRKSISGVANIGRVTAYFSTTKFVHRAHYSFLQLV